MRPLAVLAAIGGAILAAHLFRRRPAKTPLTVDGSTPSVRVFQDEDEMQAAVQQLAPESIVLQVRFSDAVPADFSEKVRGTCHDDCFPLWVVGFSEHALYPDWKGWHVQVFMVGPTGRYGAVGLFGSPKVVDLWPILGKAMREARKEYDAWIERYP